MGSSIAKKRRVGVGSSKAKRMWSIVEMSLECHRRGRHTCWKDQKDQSIGGRVGDAVE